MSSCCHIWGDILGEWIMQKMMRCNLSTSSCSLLDKYTSYCSHNIDSDVSLSHSFVTEDRFWTSLSAEKIWKVQMCRYTIYINTPQKSFGIYFDRNKIYTFNRIFAMARGSNFLRLGLETLKLWSDGETIYYIHQL